MDSVTQPSGEEYLDSGDQLRDELQRAIADNFTIDREIGRGGMATVFLANEIRPSRQVAIKVLDPDVTTRLTRRRFLREVEVVSNLTHPHIVPIFSAGSDENLLYYVMPFIEGETLRQRLSRSPLSLEETLAITRDVADALDHAHSQGVIHRDIKPENILLSGGHAVVADFGVARAMTCAECGDDFQPLTQAGLPIGTPLYMSPEQAAGQSEVDGRADVYSLGCVVYEMLSGEPPYSGGTMYEIMNKHNTAPVPGVRTPEGTPSRGIRKAVARAMSKQPTRRFLTAGDFADALSGNGPEEIGSSLESSRRTIGYAVAIGMVAIMALLAIWQRTTDAAINSVRERVLVAPFRNETGDPSLDGLGSQAADWITRSLMETGVVSVVAGGPTRPTELVQNEPDALSRLARTADAGTIIWGAYYLQAGMIQFQTQMTDAANRTLVGLVEPTIGTADNPVSLLEALGKNVSDAVRTTFGEPEGD